jgi:hypothetical protein
MIGLPKLNLIKRRSISSWLRSAELLR